MIVVSTTAIGVLAYWLYRQDTIAAYMNRAEAITQSVAAEIDAEAMEKALATGVKDSEWDHIKRAADRTAVATNLMYLYIVGSDYSDGYFTYYCEGYNPATGDDPIDFLYKEPIDIYSEYAFTAIETGTQQESPLHDDENYGWIVSSYTPVVKDDGTVVGFVGADVSMEGALNRVNLFALRAVVVAAVLCLLFALLALRVIEKWMRRPIRLVQDAADRLAAGDFGVDLSYNHEDEIGALFSSFNRMTQSTRTQVEGFKTISMGDLSVQVTPRSDKDELAFAVQTTLENLRHMVSVFSGNAESLNETAGKIAEESARLAHDANGELSVSRGILVSVDEITQKAQDNAEKASTANVLIEDIAGKARRGAEEIARMVEAVREIQKSAEAIRTVSASIDAIAFQTNILALNASVEAARAGQYGRGFAVVADEVSSLAKKSSESAHSANLLIADSLKQVAAGVEIANETSETFAEIVAGIRKNSEMLSAISAASVVQSESVERIRSDIGRMNEMISRTTESAEESAKIVDTLTGQAHQLTTLLESYHVGM
jgi:methyl-accepting chemotaxis protein